MPAESFSFRYELSALISRSPLLFSPYYNAIPKYRRLLVQKDTELVIEGFPRCANSFAVIAFESAQKRPVRLAHHIHAQLQVSRALQWNIPSLVLIREPVAAIASLLTRQAFIGASQAFRQYGRFYHYVEDHRRDIEIADFHEIIEDFRSVITRVNDRFGTAFEVYENGDKHDAQIFQSIDRLNSTQEDGDPRKLARPSSRRVKYLKEMRRRLEHHASVPALRALYERLAAPQRGS